MGVKVRFEGPRKGLHVHSARNLIKIKNSGPIIEGPIILFSKRGKTYSIKTKRLAICLFTHCDADHFSLVKDIIYEQLGRERREGVVSVVDPPVCNGFWCGMSLVESVPATNLVRKVGNLIINIDMGIVRAMPVATIKTPNINEIDKLIVTDKGTAEYTGLAKSVERAASQGHRVFLITPSPREKIKIDSPTHVVEIFLEESHHLPKMGCVFTLLIKDKRKNIERKEVFHVEMGDKFILGKMKRKLDDYATAKLICVDGRNLFELTLSSPLPMERVFSKIHSYISALDTRVYYKTLVIEAPSKYVLKNSESCCKILNEIRSSIPVLVLLSKSRIGALSKIYNIKREGDVYTIQFYGKNVIISDNFVKAASFVLGREQGTIEEAYRDLREKGFVLITATLLQGKMKKHRDEVIRTVASDNRAVIMLFTPKRPIPEALHLKRIRSDDVAAYVSWVKATEHPHKFLIIELLDKIAERAFEIGNTLTTDIPPLGKVDLEELEKYNLRLCRAANGDLNTLKSWIERAREKWNRCEKLTEDEKELLEASIKCSSLAEDTLLMRQIKGKIADIEVVILGNKKVGDLISGKNMPRGLSSEWEEVSKIASKYKKFLIGIEDWKWYDLANRKIIEMNVGAEPYIGAD